MEIKIRMDADKVIHDSKHETAVGAAPREGQAN
jgi:hypothetical protein